MFRVIIFDKYLIYENHKRIETNRIKNFDFGVKCVNDLYGFGQQWKKYIKTISFPNHLICDQYMHRYGQYVH